MSENVQVQLIDECYNCFNDGVTKIGEEICCWIERLRWNDFRLCVGF